MPGCGKYAADSWVIFVDINMSVEPKDSKLNWYMDQMRQETGDSSMDDDLRGITAFGLVELLERAGFYNPEDPTKPRLDESSAWKELKQRIHTYREQACTLLPQQEYGAQALLLHFMFEQVERFQREVIGLPIPEVPRRLSLERLQYALSHLQEELDEFENASSFEDDLDALLDLVYVALGRIVEMGIPPGAAFEEVHLKNMQKHSGTVAKRQAQGLDAIKPDGWTPPDLTPYLLVTRDQVLAATGIRSEHCADAYKPDLSPMTHKEGLELLGVTYGKSEDPRDHVLPDDAHGQAVCIDGRKRMPKLLIIGYARHGKDTVGELLQDRYRMEFTSSSKFCAKHVIMPLLDYKLPNEDNLLGGIAGNDARTRLKIDLLRMRKKNYASVDECFNDRDNFRSVWYEAIRHYNTPDASRLAREILKDNDVYCGIRSRAELNACKNVGLVDHIIWVDRLDHLPPEPNTSCDVEPWMADYVIDNNRSFADLVHNVDALMTHLLQPYARN